MPGFTTWRALPYPTVGDQPDGRTQIRDLAVALDTELQSLFTGYRLLDDIVYNSDGTFVKGNYPSARRIEVEMVGGGGGSAWLPDTDGTHRSVAMPGNGGGYAHAWINVSDLAASESVFVGTGGAGGTSGSPSGDPGADSSIGAFFSAGAGSGGTGVTFGTGATGSAGSSQGGSPGGTYDIGIIGGGHGLVRWTAGAVDVWEGLHGAAAPIYGQAAKFSTVGSSHVVPGAAQGYGSSAPGGYNNISQSAADGADGSDGLVRIKVWA